MKNCESYNFERKQKKKTIQFRRNYQNKSRIIKQQSVNEPTEVLMTIIKMVYQTSMYLRPIENITVKCLELWNEFLKIKVQQ